MSESKLYNVIAIPNAELRRRAGKTSERIATEAQHRIHGLGNAALILSNGLNGPHAHFSIRQIKANQKQLGALVDELPGVIHAHSGPIDVTALRPGGGGAFYNMLFDEDNPDLMGLRRSVYSLTTQLGIDWAPEQEGLIAPLKQLKAAQATRQLSQAEMEQMMVADSIIRKGYKDWHLTLGKADRNLTDYERTIVNDIMLPPGASASEYNGSVEGVAVHELGPSGVAIGRPLAAVALKGVAELGANYEM